MTDVLRNTVFEGELELINATWSLDSGRTVELRIVEHDDMHDLINPFKVYQKKRAGKMGQRFQAAIVAVGETTPTYSGELMLAGWADTEKGKTVKFWIDHEADTHPFAGFDRRTATKVGQLFMGVLVEIQDDGSAVDKEAEERVSPRKLLSRDAHFMVTGDLFQQYLRERTDIEGKLRRRGKTLDAATSKQYVRSVLGVESLKDLDTRPDLAARFHDEIRKPFVKWGGAKA